VTTYLTLLDLEAPKRSHNLCEVSNALRYSSGTSASRVDRIPRQAVERTPTPPFHLAGVGKIVSRERRWPESATH